MLKLISIMLGFWLSSTVWAQTYQDMFEGRVCLRCHDLKAPGTGPSFEMMAMKYEDDPEAIERLTQVVLKGSLGSWTEEVPMPPISDYSQAEARQLVQWILKYGKNANPEARSYQKYYWTSAATLLILLLGFAIYRRRQASRPRR